MKGIRLHISILLLLVTPLMLLADDGSKRKEFVREISKDFAINRTGDVHIHNRHGKVNVKTWDKSEVKIEVKIIVRAKDESQASSVFERIDVAFTNDSDYVRAETKIDSPKKSSWSWTSWGWSDNQKDDFEINYEVHLPNTGKLDLKNKYGDSFVAVTDGPVNAEIGYGSVRFEGVNNTLNLNLGYGDATIIKVEELTSEVKYSNMNVREARDMDLNTKYSKIKVDEAESLRAITKYDDFNIGTVGSLRAEGKYGKYAIRSIGKLVADGKYSDYLIEEIHKSADVVLSYGGLKIETAQPGFESIRLDGSYVNFKITTAPGASYKVDASASYGDIHLPENLDVTYKRDSGYSRRFEGNIGSNPSGSLIKVKVSYGDIRIR